jgi:hypothetical protein
LTSYFPPAQIFQEQICRNFNGPLAGVDVWSATLLELIFQEPFNYSTQHRAQRQLLQQASILGAPKFSINQRYQIGIKHLRERTIIAGVSCSLA